MNTDAIIQKIEEEARQNAAETLKEAKVEAKRMKQASDEKLAKQRSEVHEQAKIESKAMEKRMMRMAQLEQGKELLGTKQELLDETFKRALEKLYNQPKEELFEFFLNLVVENAQGNETIYIGKKLDSWFDESFIELANKKCKDKGKLGQLIYKSDRDVNETGVILRSENASTYCTLEAVVETKRAELEGQVAKVLFKN